MVFPFLGGGGRVCVVGGVDLWVGKGILGEGGVEIREDCM